MGRVSYSRYSRWNECQFKFKLEYIDKLRDDRGNIHTIFGTAMHETIQSYLRVMYDVSKKHADELDLKQKLFDNMVNETTKVHGEAPTEYVCTAEELTEFYKDGCNIIDWFLKPKNQRMFFTKRGYELVGIEVPVNLKVRDNINVIGFIDVIMKNTTTGRYTIIDLKTSTKGWNKWKRKSDITKNQIVLYKKWYSEQYNIPIDMIDVEFHIMRRKMPERELDFTIPRISRFAPANGKVTLNKADISFNQFLDQVFNNDGTYKDRDYPKNPGNHCKWCAYLGSHCDGKVS